LNSAQASPMIIRAKIVLANANLVKAIFHSPEAFRSFFLRKNPDAHHISQISPRNGKWVLGRFAPF